MADLRWAIAPFTDECPIYGIHGEPLVLQFSINCDCTGQVHIYPEPPEDVWADDAEYSSEDWRVEAGLNNTRLGYWDWVRHQREIAAENEGG